MLKPLSLGMRILAEFGWMLEWIVPQSTVCYGYIDIREQQLSSSVYAILNVSNPFKLQWK